MTTEQIPMIKARPLWPAYAAESLCSVGTTLLTVAIFFWTQRYLGWSLKQNFLLAAGQGAVYTIGALLAEPVSARWGRRRGLIGIYLILVALTGTMALVRAPAVLVALILSYSFVAGANWPMLESLVASGADAQAISRRVSLYNLVWSGSNSVTIAISGTIMEAARPGIFIASAIVNTMCVLVMWIEPAIDPPGGIVPAAHAEPEPQLLASRTLAMWLARIALPATYVVIYSMMAMMPSLPVMQRLSTAQQTGVSSIWMAARFLTFLTLGFVTWWHTRPKLLLVASVVMLVAFLGITIPLSAIARSAGFGADLAAMIAWQVVLGMALGIIYAGSLYFGMVLSQGATEHGGYHEALIGLGSVLGPGAGALTQAISGASANGKTPYVAILAVSGVIGMTIIAAGVATVRAGRR